MYNPADDKELDRMSREAADKYEAPGAASWDTLVQELNKVMPATEKKRRFFFFWWLVPLLIGGFLFFQLQTGKDGTNHTNVPTTRQGNTATPEKTVPVNTPPPPAELANEQNDLQKTVADKPGPLHHRSYTYTAVIPPVAKDDQNPILQNQNTDSIPSLTTATLPGVDTLQPKHTDTAVTSTRKPAAPARKKFSIALLAGTDVSTVKFRYGSDAGYSVGVLAGYYLSNRWSFHTGAVFTRKNYKMDGADFTAPKGSPASYWALKTVEGDCQMWEVPLLARYHFGNKVNRRFFASVGLSSYFMTSEHYDYYYPSPSTGQIVMRSGDYESGKKHPFSIAHFSAGFEQPLSRSFSLLIEPYAKLPLSGVGVGSIKLSSLGLNMVLEYRPARR